MDEPGIIATTAPRLSSWRESVSGLYTRNRTQARVLGGSLIMLTGSALVSVLNFAYNIAVARLLGPGGFGDAAVAITLLMFVSAVTLSFQLVGAKLVARSETAAEKAAVYTRLRQRAWKLGLVIGISLALASSALARTLNLESPWMVLVLAAGFTLYVPVGARRGGMQGTCAFRRLASSYVMEAAVKFAGAVIFIKLGWGTMGAIIAITASIVMAYLLPRIPAELRVTPAAHGVTSWREGVQAAVFFIGQVVISNTDILIVKHFFEADSAGQYAAVALVGRLVYFASWMVVSAMFPISAGAKENQDRKGILAVPLIFVLCLTGGFILLLSLFPDLVLHLVFGRMFVAGQGLSSLLALYAASSGVYSLSVVLIAYEMSQRIAHTGWIQLGFAIARFVVGMYLFHETLREVILLQLVFMAGLLLAVALPFLRRRGAPEATSALQELA